VISVKPNRTGGPPRRTGAEGDRFIAENVPLILLIQYAYRSDSGGLLREHVIGGPAWIDSDRFDVEAKVEGGIHAIPTREMWLMVQSLLENRFGLRVHRETRELPIYNLVVAKGGVKMKLSPDQALPNFDDQSDPPFNPASPLPGEIATTYGSSGELILAGTAIPVAPNLSSRRPHALLPNSLITVFWGNACRPVIDKTNLKGLYDFHLHFSPASLTANPDPATADASGPSLFTAVEEQLGLKLESARGPVEVLIIDSVARP
jgi:uncharacterized protein (TIGR03435 family)